jgi:hypothetical protein
MLKTPKHFSEELTDTKLREKLKKPLKILRSLSRLSLQTPKPRRK